MSIEKQLQDILKLSEETNLANESTVNELLKDMRTLNRANAIEKAANSSIISNIVPKIIFNLTSEIDQGTLSDSNTNNLANISRSLRLLQEFIPPGTIDSQYIQAITKARQFLDNKAQGIIVGEVGKEKEKILASKIMSTEMAMTPEIKNTGPRILSLPPEKSSVGIEREVESLITFVDQVPPTTMIGVQSLTPTMAVLSKYAQSMGYLSNGNITGMKSNSYVGIDVIYDDDVPINKPFPTVTTTTITSETASIQQSFRQYAGKTINAWNNYVLAEEEFIDFTNKINSKEKREEYVKSQIQGMNTETFQAQLLATLTYYYVAIPLKYMIQKAKKTFSTLQEGEKTNLFTIFWFLKNYEINPGLNYNPLTLSYSDMKKVVGILFNIAHDNFETFTSADLSNYRNESEIKIPKMVDNIYTAIGEKAIMPMGKNKLLELFRFPSVREFQASVYLRSLGIDENTLERIKKRSGSILLKTFSPQIPNLYANSEVLSLINAAITKAEEEDPLELGLFKLIWGAEKMVAYDYVWGRKLG